MLAIEASGCAEDPGQEESLDALIRSVVTEGGGTVASRSAARWTVLFGAVRSRENDAQRAVHAAFRIRYVTTTGLTGVKLRSVLATGVALVSGDRPPAVFGTPLDTCDSLLPFLTAEGIWVTAETRRRTGSEPLDDQVAMIGRERELEVLQHAFRTYRNWRRPHLVTVLGGVGTGKTRLIHEFQRSVRQGHDGRDVVFIPVPNSVDDTALPALTRGIHLCCGVEHDDPPEIVWAKVMRLARDVVTDDTVSSLRRLMGAAAGPVDVDEVLATWLRLIKLVAADRIVVLVADDLDSTAKTITDAVESLAGSLLVIAGARVDLLRDRPAWGMTASRHTTISVPPLSDLDMRSLVDRLVDSRAPDLPLRLRTTLVALSHGNPMFAAEYLERFLATTRQKSRQATDFLPARVRRTICAKIDELPPATKDILQDTTLTGATVCAATVAAVGGRSPEQVEPHLKFLATRGLLTKKSTATYYRFTSEVVRHVAYTQIPEARRADKIRNLAAWIDRLSTAQATCLREHLGLQAQRMSRIDILQHYRTTASSPPLPLLQLVVTTGGPVRSSGGREPVVGRR